jgi:hypothetical protein
MGLLEAFGLAEEIGVQALTFDELLFVADARKRKGCKMIKRMLTAEDIQRVLELGRKCAAHKEMTR